MQVSVPLIVSFVLARRLVPSLKWKNIETNKSQTMPPNQKILNNGDLSMDIALGSNEDERNDDDILSCAILGCGMMGQEHISYIQGFKDTVRIDFLVDPFQPSLDKAQKIMKEFQLPECPATCRSSPTHVPMFLKDEMELLMHSKNIDLLVIATPNYLHTDVLERWGKEDITILVEKPVAVNLEQLQRLQELKQDPGFKARIWVAMEYRYIPAIAKLMSLIPETVGDIKMITIRENRYPFLHKIGNWNRDPMKTGDTLVEKCCHFFDLFRLITKQEIDLPNVRALAQRGLNYRNESFLADGIDYPIIDAAYVTMPFEERSGNKNRTVNHDLDMIQMMNNKTPGTMGCLELCMYAEGSRHQEEIIVTGTKVSLLLCPLCAFFSLRIYTQSSFLSILSY